MRFQQADFIISQRTTRYHVPPPANLFQNASNFFKQRSASKLLQKSDWRWPERLNGGGLYDHTWWLSTPKMRVFQLFLKIRIFSTLPGLAIGRKPEFSAVFHSNTTTNEEYIYSRHRARLWVNSTRNHAFLEISSVLAAWFNHKGHVIHPTVANILRPYFLLSVFPVIVMT
jgi:hypothetical protein